MRHSQLFGRFVAAAVAVVGMLLGLAACNTIAGVGQDINAAGRAITRAAN